MPPLCTAGYGLSQGNFDYFFSALYLFIINTIFIALATFIVIKILGFPMFVYANSKKRKRIAQLATTLAIVVMVPAFFTFIDVWKESKFEIAAKMFIDRELEALPHAELIKRNVSIEYSNVGNEPSTLTINSFGLDNIPDEAISLLKDRMNDKAYAALKGSKLIFNQNRSKNLDNLKYMEQIHYRDSLDLLSQAEKIKFLEERVKRLSKYEALQIPFEQLTKEVKINYENITQLSYSSVITSNFSKIDTIPVFTVKWDNSKIGNGNIQMERDKLERWLKHKYSLDTLKVVRLP